MGKRKRDGAIDADAKAATLFNDALNAAGLTSKQVSLELGVSESLVSRWRSPNYVESPSWTQVVRLPPSFHIALSPLHANAFGLLATAMRRMMHDIGWLATAVQR